MDLQQRYEQVVHALYDGVLAAQAWHGSLRGLARATGAHNFHLLLWAPGQPTPAHSMSWGVDERPEALYREHYGAIDPRRLLVASMGEGRWMACHHHFDGRAVRRSEFYQDFLIPQGNRYLLGTRLMHHDGLDVYFGMHRAPGQAAFDEPTLRWMQHITGHFQRATRLWLDTEPLRARAALGAQALDAIELGVLAADATGHVVFANRCAQSLLREGRVLALRQGLLHAPAHDDAVRLATAFHQARMTRRPSSLRVGIADGHCTLTVLPLARSTALSACLGAPSLLVLVSHGRRRRVLTVQQLMQLFGLTPAEARLARAIAAGESLESYAAAAGVGLSTVKTQLRAVFDKTGTQRQAELARQLVIVPVARDIG